MERSRLSLRVYRRCLHQLGEASAKVEVNAQGIGSIVVFLKGDKVVSLHTAQSEGQEPLRSLESLEELAELVASRL